MPCIVGIDEAGYGPNLGPLVMTAVACRVPAELAAGDLWSALEPAVRRQLKPDDGRVLVGDSKLVYSPARGLQTLETGVLAVLGPEFVAAGGDLAAYLDRLCPASHAQLRNEPWYTGATRLPRVADAGEVARAAELVRQACERRQLCWESVRSVIVCPAEFNACLDRWGSKGAVLGQALAELLRGYGEVNGEEVQFVVDKHGGRNCYAAMLQQALPHGLVVADKESHGHSSYRVLGLSREMRLTFRPRADAEHLCVALASMVSKYVRELLMGEFNAFWERHVPGVKPTAGYPGDAARFYEAIRPAAERLGITDAALWRRK